jgi:hypothetical protein
MEYWHLKTNKLLPTRNKRIVFIDDKPIKATLAKKMSWKLRYVLVTNNSTLTLDYF